MATAARVFVWAARGNRTVDVRRLGGPRQGRFVPPPYLAAMAARDGYDLADPADRDAAYELLLSHGTAEDITGWVNLDLLARCLTGLRLAPHVAAPWRQALRDLGLLPGGTPADRGAAPPAPGTDGTDGTGSTADGPDGSGQAAGVAPDGWDGTDTHRPTVPIA